MKGTRYNFGVSVRVFKVISFQLPQDVLIVLLKSLISDY